MPEPILKPAARELALLEDAIGYLNFSSGASDPKFLRALCELFGRIEPGCPAGQEPVGVLCDWLLERMTSLSASSATYHDVGQAKSVVVLLRDHLLGAYRKFHRDLLWHQPDRELWRPLFLGRGWEALLSQGPPWAETDRIVSQSLELLNDYLGYRPLAVLESERSMEPYAHERLRPIPLYIREVGVAPGEYCQLVERALAILGETDPDILHQAWFDTGLLDELALDPRAYDFDHPASKRPNHHFGQWDTNQVDQRGYYRRFVLQQMTLDALLTRVAEGGGASRLSREELLAEAAAVLAGTILMASGTTGNGPGCHGSEVTLSSLLPHIAGYRDQFYEQLLGRMGGSHGERLRAEAKRSRQPFGGARQHLNQELARRRAVQMQHVHLAQLYARMGYPQAAQKEANGVRIASARMLCRIYCLLTAGHQAIDVGQLEMVARDLPTIEDLFERGIECGAFVDPWTILGFAGNYSLFPALENTVHDFRVDDQIELVEQILDLCARAWTEASALDDEAHEAVFSAALSRLATWWDKYATASVSGVKRLVGKEIEISANLVAGALSAWHKAGAAAGDVKFWRMFVDQFDSPKAFQLVVEALLERGDRVASMALMLQWISQAEFTPLEDGDASFHPLALRWLQAVEEHENTSGTDQWPLVAKFFQHLEASADAYWRVPTFDLTAGMRPKGSPPNREEFDELDDEFDEEMDDEDLDDEDLDDEDLDDELDEDYDGEEDNDIEAKMEAEFAAEYGDEFGGENSGGAGLEAGVEDEELPWDDEDVNANAEGGEDVDEGEEEPEEIFGAAYENMVYRDSTDDGFDRDTLDEFGRFAEFELEAEAQRLSQRLEFLTTVARLWRQVAIAWKFETGDKERRELLEDWCRQARERQEKLLKLAAEVHAHAIPAPGNSHDAMVEFDRRRMIKDTLLEQVITTSVETSSAGRLIWASMPPKRNVAKPKGSGRDDGAAIAVLRGLLAGDAVATTEAWRPFINWLRGQELLYIPTAKGGEPRRIVQARSLGQLLDDLLRWLPRLGLVRETCQLLDVAQAMEVEHPVGPGAVTEYDRLFTGGYQAIVRALVDSSETWDLWREGDGSDPLGSVVARPSDAMLVEALQDLTESQLTRWLAHSRTLRLSVVERFSSESDWQAFVAFVNRYGEDLFTQKFLNLGNLRAILHQGAGEWLSKMANEEEGPELMLTSELGRRITLDEAAKWLTIAIETVVENYREYRDYNTTTTSSDHGELLYTLIDFIRLRAGYDRVAWNLRPVVMAHEILVRRNRPAAAEMWQQALSERTAETADANMARFESLCNQYGVRLPSIAERLGERFTRPLAIDRVRALVWPAMAAAETEDRDPIRALEEEIASLASEPAGSGLDLPDWLAALEEEASAVRCRLRQQDLDDAPRRIQQVALSWEAWQRQIAGDSK
ncbi:MAG: hypothetical protein IT425_06225 [Pirellulales bacterium]|nr:hypothetical protein [Pirellulales bacterium]